MPGATPRRSRLIAELDPGTTPPPRFSYASDELDALAGADNYYRAVVRRFAPHLGTTILEVGAGVGTFAVHLLEQVPTARLTLVEPAQNNFALLEARFAADARVETINGYLDAVARPESMDSVIAVNVLEHVRDESSFLRAAYQMLAPGGHLLLYVPALPFLFGTLDEVFEHFRRYTRPSLSRALRATGFHLNKLSYTNFPGVFSWFVSGRVLRRRTISAREIQTYDRMVMPVVAAVERVVSPPIGQSLIAIATRY